jgi:hypothetical protein
VNEEEYGLDSGSLVTSPGPDYGSEPLFGLEISTRFDGWDSGDEIEVAVGKQASLKCADEMEIDLDMLVAVWV